MEYDCSNELVEQFKSRIAAVDDSISEACKTSGRSRSDVTLIGVSKVFPVQYAQAAVVAGLKDLGENRVQELVPKVERLDQLELKPNWHLIGTLQKNKVKYIIGKTNLIHSVNTIDLAEEISKRSVGAGIVTDILLQGNISGEESKHGFAPDELKMAVDRITELDGVRLRGLMTMAPIETYDGQAREVFADTYKIYEELRSYVKLPEAWNVLSMGMSQDYKAAIKEGATHIRIGTAIFGDRTKLSL